MFSYDTGIVLFYFLFLIGVLILPTFLIKFCKPELSSGNVCNISETFCELLKNLLEGMNFLKLIV